MASDPLDTTRGPFGGAARAVARAWRRQVLARAEDVTASAADGSCLVVAARPGDEVLGCGATIARKRAAGTDVDLVIVTDGRHLRPSRLLQPGEVAARLAAEAADAAAMLGVDADHVHLLGFEEGTLERCQGDVVTALGKLLRRTGAEVLLLPGPTERDATRAAVHAATCRAVVESGHPPRTCAYLLDAWAEPPARPPRPSGHQVVRAERFRYLQAAALERYPTRTTNVTGELTWPTLSPHAVAALTGTEDVFRPLAVEQLAHHAEGTAAEAEPALLPRRRLVAAPVADTFDGVVAAGQVLGSRATSGARRRGADAEGTLAVEGGRLRLGHLRRPGWGRQGIAYGPFERRPGLTLAVRATASHHNAHSLAGPRSARGVLGELRRNGPSRDLLRPALDDNLLVGFHAGERPDGPAGAANAFVVHAGGARNGELRATVAGRAAPLHLGLQELDVTYVVVLREQGATYYVSGPAGASGLGAWPSMRPIAVDVTDATTSLFAGLHQSVHAEAHYELSSSVDEVHVAEVADLARWCASALAADTFVGHGPLLGSSAEVGGVWAGASEGGFLRTGGGAAATGRGAAAQLELSAPAGLVHVLVHLSANPSEAASAGLTWRGTADGDGWRVLVGRDRAELAVATAGRWEVVAEGPAHLPAAHRSSLQVLDDGRTMGVLLDGRLLFDGWVEDERHASGRAVGVLSGPTRDVLLGGFEAHGRAVPVPAELGLSGPWDWRGARVVVEDRFEGPRGELAGSDRPGMPRWARSLGPGVIDLTGSGSARVRADRHSPNPGRTAYTVAWPGPDFADLEVELVPPGTARSQGEGSRGGLVFWQDEDNYLVLNVWVDDSPTHDGSAVSLFLRGAGHEREAEALWTNVGRAVSWGRPATLSAASDGEHVLVRLDGEPVLHRRVSDVHSGAAPLQIRRVGIVVNREWGDDTGTTFLRFTARAGVAP